MRYYVIDKETEYVCSWTLRKSGTPHRFDFFWTQSFGRMVEDFVNNDIVNKYDDFVNFIDYYGVGIAEGMVDITNLPNDLFFFFINDTQKQNISFNGKNRIAKIQPLYHSITSDDYDFSKITESLFENCEKDLKKISLDLNMIIKQFLIEDSTNNMENRSQPFNLFDIHPELSETYTKYLISFTESNQLLPTIKTFESLYFSNILFQSIAELISRNIFLRKCENCDKYFAVTGNSSTKYCNKVAENENKPCNIIGATRSYHNKFKEDKANVLYKRVYGLFYARKNKGELSDQEFRYFCNDAKDRSQEVKNGKMPIEEFEIWVDKVTKRKGDARSVIHEELEEGIIFEEMEE